MDRKTKEKIKQLKRQKKYDEIFVNYGAKIYKKNAPKKYRKKELRKLKKEGKYFDIYNKYGEKEYNKILLRAMTQEIKENSGFFKAFSWRVAQSLKKVMKKIGLGITIGTSTLMIGGTSLVQSTIDENAQKYESEIEEYEDNITQYAKEVQALNLNHLQTIMKVMDDMWENIAGYATPEKDVIGFFELDLADKDGYGQCRNMASDVAKKLNKIDQRYNARTINVKMVAGDYDFANIETRMAEPENADSEGQEQEQEGEGDTTLDNLVGNHMVVLASIPDRDITLVIDPTNPGLGIYENGQIKMFNTEEKWEGKEIATIMMNGYEGTGMIEKYVNSFSIISKYEEAIEEFGLEKQNEALEYVRSLEENGTKTRQSRKTYTDSLKVPNETMTNTTKGQQSQNTTQSRDGEIR